MVLVPPRASWVYITQDKLLAAAIQSKSVTTKSGLNSIIVLYRIGVQIY